MNGVLSLESRYSDVLPESPVTDFERWLRGKLNQPMMNQQPWEAQLQQQGMKTRAFNPTWMDTKNVVSEIMPGIGDLKALEDAASEYKRGSLGGALFNTATAVPGLGELAMGGKAMLPLFGAMTAFHGSPHKFSKVSNEAIGTGEGAQKYGYGHYYGESRGTGEWYQKQLADSDTLKFSDGTEQRLSDYGDFNTRSAARYLAEAENDYSKARKLASKDGGVYESEIVEWLDALESNGAKVDVGYLYEVDIPDEKIGQMLDWDAPLSEQPKVVQDQAAEIYAEAQGMQRNHENFKSMVETIRPQLKDISGADLYKKLSEMYHYSGAKNADEMASKELASLGIPGIKYYDGASRSAKDGTRNFVVFDEADVKILKRNDEPL